MYYNHFKNLFDKYFSQWPKIIRTINPNFQCSTLTAQGCEVSKVGKKSFRETSGSENSCEGGAIIADSNWRTGTNLWRDGIRSTREKSSSMCRFCQRIYTKQSTLIDTLDHNVYEMFPD